MFNSVTSLAGCQEVNGMLAPQFIPEKNIALRDVTRVPEEDRNVFLADPKGKARIKHLNDKVNMDGTFTLYFCDPLDIRYCRLPGRGSPGAGVVVASPPPGTTGIAGIGKGGFTSGAWVGRAGTDTDNNVACHSKVYLYTNEYILTSMAFSQPQSSGSCCCACNKTRQCQTTIQENYSVLIIPIGSGVEAGLVMMVVPGNR
jgi:hypothetical protein